MIMMMMIVMVSRRYLVCLLIYVSTTTENKKQRATIENIARLALDDLQKYFDLPIIEASKSLNVGLTVLKKKCMEVGTPHGRKIKSLDSLILDLQVLSMPPSNVSISAYEQTGTGKTLNMEGTKTNRRINCRTTEELFITAKKRNETFTYDISVSVLEVYNKQIKDCGSQNRKYRSPSGMCYRLEIVHRWLDPIIVDYATKVLDDMSVRAKTLADQDYSIDRLHD